MNGWIGVYMFIVSMQDFRYKKIPLWMLVSFAVGGGIYRLCSGISSDLLISLLPGAVLCTIAYLCSTSLGMADGILAVAYGLFYGWKETILWMMYSFVLASIIGVICAICTSARKKQLPFIPFMFLSHVGMCI